MSRPALTVHLMLSSLLCWWVSADDVQAHVYLDAPNGGELLDRGSTFTITWTIQISHNTQNWDLWYSTKGSSGPWKVIAMDLPPGNTSAGSVHTYSWTVPDEKSRRCYVRVRMDNTGTDYEDISDAAFTMRPLILDPGGTTFQVGDNVTFTLRATTLPNQVVALYAIDVNGTAIFIPISFGRLDASGSFSFGGVVPPSAAGLNVKFKGFCTNPSGPLETSNRPTLIFQ